MCQELLVQWNQKLLQRQEMKLPVPTNKNLIFVSIGLPSKASWLFYEHLQLNETLMSSLYVENEDALWYDWLALNRGVRRTFFHPSTPMAFLQRIVNKNSGGLQDLGSVLQKWKGEAVIVPPNPTATSLLQGGTFVMDRDRTLYRTIYAHYDPSTAAHASPDRVLQVWDEWNNNRNRRWKEGK